LLLLLWLRLLLLWLQLLLLWLWLLLLLLWLWLLLMLGAAVAAGVGPCRRNPEFWCAANVLLRLARWRCGLRAGRLASLGAVRDLRNGADAQWR
jgi:hypothetical protein